MFELDHYLSAFLPEDLLPYFIVTQIEEVDDTSKQMCFRIHLEEKNQLPPAYSSSDYE